jgi:hypothetical protein
VRYGETWQRICAEFSDAVLSECEASIGLRQPNKEFRAAIVDAVFLALCLHAAPPKRAATLRAERKSLKRRATAAATALQNLSVALDQSILPRPLADSPEPLATLIAPPTLDCLRALATAAGQDADRLKGRSGPTGVAFRIVIRMVADAFGDATGRRAGLTWSAHRERYEGQFWGLLVRLLPRAETIAGKFAPEHDVTRGRRVQKILTAMDRTSATTPK